MPAAIGRAYPAAANPLHSYRHAFHEWAEARAYSAATVATRDRAIARFIGWADERGINRPADISRAVLERYQRHLFLARKADGAPLSLKTQESLLNPLRAWFKWMTRENHILYNPASELVLPRSPRQLPKVLLSVADVEGALNQPDIGTPWGLRDRAILETLYSTGIRRMELTRLTLYDVDLAAGTVMVRLGKGAKDRLIPIGARAAAWVVRYVEEVRPQLAIRSDELALFLTDYGEPFEKNRLGDLVRRYMRHAGIVHGSCHAFRHAMATHMLENGADIRFIQAMLGHSELSTTQIYTQVSIGKLKEIHAATHPARIERPGRDNADADRGEAQHDREDAAAAILAALAMEDDEEEADAVAADAPPASRR
ncbi:MAG: site-specific tyrosine recombinase XerC [Rhodocyclaceae bacterium]|nr:site-specific tyrosine recombinase XerC [Rhodocyclaceae bacterium]